LFELTNYLQGCQTELKQKIPQKLFTINSADKKLFDLLYTNNYILLKELDYHGTVFATISSSKAEQTTNSGIVSFKTRRLPME
ncbi:unnamed protein product, partial [Didymodactylos carnosus]